MGTLPNSMDKPYLLMLASAAAGAVLASAILLHATASTSSSTLELVSGIAANAAEDNPPGAPNWTGIGGCASCRQRGGRKQRSIELDAGGQGGPGADPRSGTFQGCTYRGETGWNALEALQRGRKRDRPWLSIFGGRVVAFSRPRNGERAPSRVWERR